MSPITMAVTVAAVVVTFASGTPLALTPTVPAEASTTVQFSSPIYPAGKTWEQLLSQSPELTDLTSCESGQDPMKVNYRDAKITGFPSYGLLQFQPGTFLAYVKKYDAIPGATDEEIAKAIYDPYVQIYVAEHMIADGQGHQWTCYVMLGLAKKYPLWTLTPSELVSKSLD